ncbi:hypothetical protein [Jatrophihabitans fulvus]
MVMTYARQLLQLRQRLRDQTQRLDAHELRLNRQLKRLDEFQKRLDEWSLASARSRVEYDTAAHQLAALEVRIAALEDATVEPGDDAARAEARQLVDVVRTEHARVRTRLTLFGAYEERLRRVEAALLHAIALREFPTPAQEHVGADVVEAREKGLIPPDGTQLPAR